jgi:hypothetical protein
MSLTNQYERLLAKNLLISAADHTIPNWNGGSYKELWIGLHIGSALVESGGDTPVAQIVEPVSTSGNWAGHDNNGEANGKDTGTGYQRINLANALGDAGISTNNVDAFDEADIDAYTGETPLTNANPIRFPVALDDWGTVASWFICTSPDLGEDFVGGTQRVLVYGNVNNPTDITVNDRAIFNDGALSITIQ